MMTCSRQLLLFVGLGVGHKINHIFNIYYLDHDNDTIHKDEHDM